MLQILEAILWPRGLLRANMSSQNQRGADSSLTSHKNRRTSSVGVVLMVANGAILGVMLGAWEAMLGGYVVHFGFRRCHFADIAGHLVAKRAAESQHEQPEPERCRFLVDVAQKSWPVEPSWGPSWGFGRPCWEAM